MAGRDLLNTHLARDPARRPAVPVRMGPGRLFPAGRAGAAGRTGRARPPDRGPLHRPGPVRQVPGHRGARRGLRAACGWLQVLSTSVQAAQQADPVTAANRDLLARHPAQRAPAPPRPGRQRTGHRPVRRGDRQRRTGPARRLDHRHPACLVAAPDRGLTPPRRRHQHGHQPPLRDPAPHAGRPHRRRRRRRAQRQPGPGRRRRRARPRRLAAPGPRPQPGRH